MSGGSGALPPIVYPRTHYAAFLEDVITRLVAEVPPAQAGPAGTGAGPVVTTVTTTTAAATTGTTTAATTATGAPAGPAPVGAASSPGGPPLARLQLGDSSDWIVGLAEAWAALAEIFTFYQERIIGEAFLATATQPGSITHLFNSLGHDFTANATASTVVAYQLSASTAGPDAVSRAQAAGTGATVARRAADLRAGAPGGVGAGAVPPSGPADLAGLLADFGATVGPGGVLGAAMPATAAAPGSQPARRTTIPAAAQIKALPGPGALPATYVTLTQLDAQVDLSGLAARLSVPPAPTVIPATTQLVLAGVRTGLAVGQPVVVEAEDAASGQVFRWARSLLAVQPDPRSGTTRVSWRDPLGPAPSAGPAPEGVALTTGRNVKLYRFATSAPLFGATAPMWTALTLGRRLAGQAVDGAPLPTRGGLLRRAGAGAGWTPVAGWPAATGVTGLVSSGDAVVVAAGDAGLLRSVGGGPYAPVSMGGARRYVFFVGGTSSRLLAGTSRGGVYQSLDGGLTWGLVTGGPPSVPSTGTIVTHQIPPVAVRSVVALDNAARGQRTGSPATLLAGTDQGAYVYDGTDWAPDGLPPAVYALLADPRLGMLAGTESGVWQRRTVGGKATWVGYGSGLTSRVYALALADTRYAATDNGVWRLLPGDGQLWIPVNGAPGAALPPTAAVRTLVADGSSLLAGTDAGLYRSSDQGATWARDDDVVGWTWPGDDLVAGTPAPPPTLVQGFGDHGIVIGPDAVLVATSTGYRIDAGPDTWLLDRADGGWQVRLAGVLAPVTALASGDGVVLAGGGPVAPVATEWPGFTVAGTHVDLASAHPQVVPGSLAVLSDQSAGSEAVTVLDVSTTGPVELSGFGRQAAVTRLGFTEPLAPGRFSRRTSRVWLQSGLLALAPPPPAPVTALSGGVVPLAAELPVAPPPGRVAAITGKPLGLAVAPLGGAYQVTPTATVAVGPAQADGVAVTLDGAGRTYLGTSEGVFVIAPGAAGPVLLADGWPRDQPEAAALTSFSGSVLAGTTNGVLELRWDGPAVFWVPSGLSGSAVVALASDATQVVAATSTGGVFRRPAPPPPPAPEGGPEGPPRPEGAPSEGPPSEGPLPEGPLPEGPRSAASDGVAADTAGGAPDGMTADGVAADAGADAPGWTSLTPLPGIVTLAVGAGAVYGGTGTGVARLTPEGTWQALPAGFQGTGPAGLAVDGSGAVWAGSGSGLQSLQPGPDQWYPEPSLLPSGPVQALAAGPDGRLTVATAGAVVRRSAAGQWERLASDPGGPVAALAVAADGTVWLAGRAVVPFTPEVPRDVAAQHHQLVCSGVPLDGADIATLDQGGLPTVVAEALAAAGRTLDTSSTAVRAQTPGSCWVVLSGPTLYVMATRTRPSSVTLSAWLNLVASYPTRGVPAGAPVQTWPVERNGVLGSLRARQETFVPLAAGPDAPSLAETTVVVAASGPATTTPATGTDLALSAALTGIYDAATVAVNLNVVGAVQGRPVRRILGSGDPNTPHQSFDVPTPVAALPAGAGAVVTSGSPGHLWVFVDGQLWSEVPSLLAAQPGDRAYRVRAKADGTATVHFGDGVHGALLPAGQNNVVAQYLEGGGPDGQVSAGQLIQPLTRPQLVTGVFNPMAGVVPPDTSAGDPAMVAVRTLGHSVTLSDFQEAAAAQPGVTAASADLVRCGLRRAVVVTVAVGGGASADRLAAIGSALGGPPGDVGATWVLAAELVPVALSLEIDARASAVDAVTAAVGQLAATQPGDALLASQILSAVSAVAGVAGVRIVGWHRDGHPATTATRLPAGRAGWRPGSAAPHPAELLVVDGNLPRLSISVRVPLGGTTP